MHGSATTHHLVQRMLEEIQHNYSQRLTLTTFARMLERQSAYLGRLFREEVGITVREYITRARMTFGAAQVRAGMKIEAIALDLGYRSKKNFYRQFKRRFGMTPEAYRRDQHDESRGRSAAGRRRASQTGGDSPIAVLVTDDNGRLVAANRPASAISGYTAAELRGMPAGLLLPDRAEPDLKCRLQMLLQATPALPRNALLRTKSAQSVHVHLISVANML